MPASTDSTLAEDLARLLADLLDFQERVRHADILRFDPKTDTGNDFELQCGAALSEIAMLSVYISEKREPGPAAADRRKLPADLVTSGKINDDENVDAEQGGWEKAALARHRDKFLMFSTTLEVLSTTLEVLSQIETNTRPDPSPASANISEEG